MTWPFLDPWSPFYVFCLWSLRWQSMITKMTISDDTYPRYMIYDDICFMFYNMFMIWYDMFNLDIWWSWWYMIHDDDIYCWTCLIFMLMLMLDLWLQAETPGVTHFGAYHRPPDGHFCQGKNWPRGHSQITHFFPHHCSHTNFGTYRWPTPHFNCLASFPHPHPTHPKSLTKIHGSHVFLYFCLYFCLYFRLYFFLYLFLYFCL